MHTLTPHHTYLSLSLPLWSSCVPSSEACWSSLGVDPALGGELQARLEAGEFWVDEAVFVSQFDDVTVGYPVTEDGHLRSIFTGTHIHTRTHTHTRTHRSNSQAQLL